MSASFSVFALAIVCAALCASVANGQWSLASWPQYIAQRQDYCSNITYQTCGDGNCYNPPDESCIESGGIFRVCPNNSLLCGMNCYFPSSQVCLQNLGVYSYWYQQCKMYEIFDVRYQACVNNSGSFTVCQIGNQLCGLQCYDPSLQYCASNFEMPLVCPMGYKLCNNGECYNPTTQRCMLYTVGQSLPSYSVCPKNFKLCGDKCYHPRRDTCRSTFISSLVCDINATTVCNTYSGRVCYNPSWQNCIRLSSDYSIVCPRNNSICWSNVNFGSSILQGQCYDPATQTCVTDGPYTAVCPIGFELCNGNCYSSSSQQCLTVLGKFKVLCPIDYQVCATIYNLQCYNPAWNVCVSSGNYTLLCDRSNPNICPSGNCCA